MEFLDKLGKKASEAYKVTADKTGKLAKEAKLRMKIGDLKSQINDIYREIGEIVYQKHTREGEYDIEKEIEEKCTKIDVLSDEIENLLKQCLELNDKKQCEKCYTEIEKKAKFCPHCGAKQEVEIAIEAEILNNKTVHVENDIETEKEEIEIDQSGPVVAEASEASEQNSNNKDEEQENEKTNLEKTVEIESNVETNEDEEKIEKSQEEVSESEKIEESEEVEENEDNK